MKPTGDFGRVREFGKLFFIFALAIDGLNDSGRWVLGRGAFKSTLWCKVPTWGVFFCLTLVPFLTNLMKFCSLLTTDSILPIKVFNDETISLRTTLSLKVYLPYFNATLHAPKIWAVVQTSFLQSVEAAWVEIFHRWMLLVEGRTSKVEARQKETRFISNANKDFHEKSFWT